MLYSCIVSVWLTNPIILRYGVGIKASGRVEYRVKFGVNEIAMIPSQQSRVVIEKAGYRRQRLSGGTLILRLLDGRPETIAAWYDDCQKIMSAWRPGRRLRYLHDICNAETITPFAVDRVVNVLRRMRKLPISDGRGAILTRSPQVAGLLSTFLKRRRYANWQIQFFNDEAEALRWLNE